MVDGVERQWKCASNCAKDYIESKKANATGDCVTTVCVFLFNIACGNLIALLFFEHIDRLLVHVLWASNFVIVVVNWRRHYYCALDSFRLVSIVIRSIHVVNCWNYREIRIADESSLTPLSSLQPSHDCHYLHIINHIFLYIYYLLLLLVCSLHSFLHLYSVSTSRMV